MLDFQQKRKLRKVVYHRTTLIILGIVVLFAIHSTWSVYQKLRQSGQQRRLVEQSEAELSARDADLQNKISQLQTNYGIEQEIRAKFNVAKGEENVAIVLDSDNSSQPTSTPALSFWRKFLNFLRI